MQTRTLGFLFTDLRGYTKFLEEHGDAAGAELVRDYRSIVRDCIRSFDAAALRVLDPAAPQLYERERGERRARDRQLVAAAHPIERRGRSA